ARSWHEHNRGSDVDALKTTVRNRRIEVDAPAELTDGTQVLIEMTAIPAERIGIEESEWRDDQVALADWEAWIKTVEPLELSAEEREAFARFDEEFRRFNLEAVRKQMAEKTDP